MDEIFKSQENPKTTTPPTSDLTPKHEAEQETTEALPYAVERIVKKAYGVIDDHKQDFLAAGIQEEQLEAAKINIRQKALAEHEEREKQDPLNRIREALAEAATTNNEHKFAHITSFQLDGQRNYLLDVARNPRERLSGGGWHRSEWRGNQNRHAVISAIYPTSDENGHTITPTPAFMERFLENLGVLERTEKEGEALNEFMTRYYPKHDQRGLENHSAKGPFREIDREAGPRQGQEWVTRIPTDIEGVEIRIPFSLNEIELSIAPQTLQKIQPPQTQQF
ncbi:hypothetical protein C4577_02350 [Candidatus Parcubacteria bacterium]|nr:MAG: hypothetical protein C4577_02350 [Candidatus Parcubacteria bacterium]